jgi:hypothetical protein
MSQVQVRDHWTTRVVETGSAWRAAEDELVSAGVRIPLSHTLAWAEFGLKNSCRLLTVRDGEDRLAASVAVRMDRSRVLPGHCSLRVDELDALPSATLEPTIAALTRLVRSNPKFLRLTVRLFSRGDRREAASLLERYGYRLSTRPDMYRYTLTLNLHDDEQAIFASLHRSARRNIRHMQQHSTLVQRTLTDSIYGDRIRALHDESMGRHGGRHRNLDWQSILRLSHLHPDLSRISGLFLSESDSRPEALVAFCWGTMQGDHGTYTAAGTTRLPNTRAAFSYPLLWDLILWARQGGAEWFDFGGVTIGNHPDDQLQGISRFKGFFSRTVEEVSEEWTIEPNPYRAFIARWPGRGVNFISSLVGRRKT